MSKKNPSNFVLPKNFYTLILLFVLTFLVLPKRIISGNNANGPIWPFSYAIFYYITTIDHSVVIANCIYSSMLKTNSFLNKKLVKCSYNIVRVAYNEPFNMKFIYYYNLSGPNSLGSIGFVLKVA